MYPFRQFYPAVHHLKPQTGAELPSTQVSKDYHCHNGYNISEHTNKIITENPYLEMTNSSTHICKRLNRFCIKLDVDVVAKVETIYFSFITVLLSTFLNDCLVGVIKIQKPHKWLNYL